MIELAANFRGTRAHYTTDLEPLSRYVPDVAGRHGSSLCTGRAGLLQVFDQEFMDAYPPAGRAQCVIAELRVCRLCTRCVQAAATVAPVKACTDD